MDDGVGGVIEVLRDDFLEDGGGVGGVFGGLEDGGAAGGYGADEGADGELNGEVESAGYVSRQF